MHYFAYSFFSHCYIINFCCYHAKHKEKDIPFKEVYHCPKFNGVQFLTSLSQADVLLAKPLMHGSSTVSCS